MIVSEYGLEQCRDDMYRETEVQSDESCFLTLFIWSLWDVRIYNTRGL